jgi:PilZ domain
MTYDSRRHKRFRSDLTELYGKMILTKKVEIIDISLSGVALRTDRQLNIGREYPLRLVWKGKTLDVWGVVVRSEKLGIEERDNGKNVSLYRVGVMFKDVSSETIADFINSIEWDEKEAVSVMVDNRPNDRFDITTPGQRR